MDATSRRRAVRVVLLVVLGIVAAVALERAFDSGPAPFRRVNAVHSPPAAQAALDRAERAYDEAAGVLEAQYAAGKPRLGAALARRHDAELLGLQRAIAQARQIAGADLDARIHVLDVHRAYVEALQRAVFEIPEVSR